MLSRESVPESALPMQPHVKKSNYPPKEVYAQCTHKTLFTNGSKCLLINAVEIKFLDSIFIMIKVNFFLKVLFRQYIGPISVYYFVTTELRLYINIGHRLTVRHSNNHNQQV